MNNSYCFRCAQPIISPPKNDPIWEAVGEAGTYFNPAYVIEVLENNEECKCIVICWKCFEEIAPDMWLDKAAWELYNPIVTYEMLPHFDHNALDREDYTKYQFPTKDEK